MLIIPALGRQRQDDPKFTTCLDYLRSWLKNVNKPMFCACSGFFFFKSQVSHIPSFHLLHCLTSFTSVPPISCLMSQFSDGPVNPVLGYSLLPLPFQLFSSWVRKMLSRVSALFKAIDSLCSSAYFSSMLQCHIYLKQQLPCCEKLDSPQGLIS